MRKTNLQSFILCVDIGNTATSIGLSRGDGIIRDGRMATENIARIAEVCAVIRPLLAKTCCSADDISAVVICSVVPAATSSILKKWPGIFSNARFLTMGKNLHIPVRNAYRVPGQVGCDRLANAVAAKYYYRLPAIIVDFGTAVTIDIVNADAEYIGGMIFPGLQTSLNALYNQTALLPRAKLARPKQLVGRDTVNSMLSGVFYATGLGVEGVLDELKNHINPSPLVIGTGGHVHLMEDLVSHLNAIDPLLTLKGIEKTYFESKIEEKN